MTTEILKCNCSHEFQDKVYGKGMRVFNENTKASIGQSSFNCTVCGSNVKLGSVIKKKGK